MSAGDILLYLAAVMLFLALGARVLSYTSKDKKMASLSGTLSLISFMTITIAFIYLSYMFLVSDFSYYYVWSNSSTDLSSVYKFSGVWAGAEGSLLLWIWFMSIVLAVEAILEPRRNYLGKKFHDVFQCMLTGTLLVFMMMLLAGDLFEPTSQGLLTYYPNGAGVNLSLQTPEMVVHPPIIFAGYATAIATAGAAIAFFLAREKNWHTVAFPWTRISWILLTLGIGIGGLWAYYVLGWGGYWAWDPVETSSLIPWFIATAFLHTLIRHSRKGEYGIVAPLLGVLTFVGMLFAAFATRAGSIWSSSVHAFAGTIMDDPVVLGLLILMVSLLALGIYLAYSKYRLIGPKEEEPEPEKFSEYISDRNNMLLTVALLVVTAAVMIFILFKNVNVSQDANYAEFNQKMSIFFVLLMVTMTLCLTWKMFGKDRALYFGLGLIALSAALAAIGVWSDSIDWLVAFSIPSYAVAIGAAVTRLAKSRTKGSLKKTLFRASAQVIHLGVAMILFSYVVSSNMQTYPDDAMGGAGSSAVLLDIGEEAVIGDYSILLKDLDLVSESTTSGTVTITAAQEATIDIERSGHMMASDAVLTNLYGYDWDLEPKVLEVEVYIHKSAFEDLYINFQYNTNSTAYLQVKVIPLMNFLWLGLGLLVAGLALRLFSAPFTLKEDTEEEKPAGRSKQVSPPAAAEKDYESIVEEELKKYKQKRSGK